MVNDPIVEEVRKVRKTIESACGNDAQKYYEHLTKLQKKYSDRLVRRGPQPILATPLVAEGKAPYGKARLLTGMLAAGLAVTAHAMSVPVVVCPPEAPPRQQLAAKEVARYVYLRTGARPDVAGKLPARGDAIVLAADPALDAEAFALTTAKQAGRRVWTIAGGTGGGVLHGAYRFAERLGVRFYLHGDVIPDERLTKLPEVNETDRPLFKIRGIQPFHDFPEGPDWWNQDDYLAYVGQLAKLRMNFIGLHCYPQGNVGPEPLVWIGLAADQDEHGQVRFSYPAQWAHTGRDKAWGYTPMQTADFTGGTGQLFPDDDYGPDVQQGLMPLPNTPAQQNELFNRIGQQFRVVFAQAKALGVKTCIGTETPLTIPTAVKEHLKNLGKNPDDPATVRELYQGMFQRIAALCPVDYYWLWTPEGWTWGGNKPEQFAATQRDILAAYDALQALGRPFTLATCGWVLGPQHDRTALDQFLPKDCPMSCINRDVGHTPVEEAFASIRGRPKWAIPWMENDPNLIAYQPWVGRMRSDALGARLLGCDGLIGIHWRTKIMAMNVAALAASAWDQTWAPAASDVPPVAPSHPPAETRRPPAQRKEPADKQRTMPIQEFYVDFARAHFGDAVAGEAGALLASLDGMGFLPNPSDWKKGPGALTTNSKLRQAALAKGTLVEQFGALRAQMVGAGNLQRFDYWLNTLRASVNMYEQGGIRGDLAALAKEVADEKNADRKTALARDALALRLDLVRKWDELMRLEISVADTPGELGTIANLEQHSRVFDAHLTAFDQIITNALGQPLPAAATPAKDYRGEPRITVLTVRSAVAPGEALALRIIALDRQPAQSVTVRVRPLGRRSWHSVPVTHLNRAVYQAQLPAATDDFEYYAEAQFSDGRKLTWPATAPDLSQTVVVWAPPADASRRASSSAGLETRPATLITRDALQPSR